MQEPESTRIPTGNQDEQLSEAAALLLETIPPPVAPTQLAAEFPRIANRIAGLWKIPRQMDPYLDSLIMDKRGGRKGFPAPIAWELLRLKDYYQTVVYPLPKPPGSWDAVI
jgi:hypothetical protein